MSEAALASERSRGGRLGTVLLSWAIFGLVIFQLYMSTKVGTTPRGTQAREDLQHLHLSVGLTALALVLPRLYLWWRQPLPPRPPGVPASSEGLFRTTCLLFYVTVLLFGITGPIFAWSEGHAVAWFGVPLPALLEPSYFNTVRFGYVHSALSFWVMMLAVFAVGVALYQWARFRVSPLRMLPGRG
jgi:cytochrome b561